MLNAVLENYDDLELIASFCNNSEFVVLCLYSVKEWFNGCVGYRTGCSTGLLTMDYCTVPVR